MLPSNKTKNLIKKKFDLFKIPTSRTVENDKENDTEDYTDLHKLRTSFTDPIKNIDKYTYPFIDTIDFDIDDEEIKTDLTINLCIYRVNTNGNKPFLEFLLYKYPDKGKISNLFTFPNFKYDKNDSLIKQTNKYIDVMFDDVTRYKGFKLDKTHCTLFYQRYFDKQINIPKLTLDNTWWWVSSCEIFNYKKVLYFDIHRSVVDLFERNPEIMFLYNNKTAIEVPLILYNGSHYKSITFMTVFGIKKGSIYASMGPFYYFSTFVKAMRYACYSYFLEKYTTSDGEVLTTNDYGKYNKGGIVRFAIFPGKTKVFMEDDPPDTSAISLNSDKLAKWARNLSLRDSDGKWSKEYSCAYVGEYTVTDDSNNKITRSPFWTLKNYEQQTPLSYHSVNMEAVPAVYDTTYTDYEIE